jgi:hypothetical protein
VVLYVYLGEKVVSEKEYRSAMAGYVSALQVGEDVQVDREKRCLAGWQTWVSKLFGAVAPGNRLTRSRRPVPPHRRSAILPLRPRAL